MITLTANLSARAHRDTLYGCEYLVAPLTLIVPGVLNGSKGALFYPQDEIAKNVEAWNGIPITVYHPSADNLVVTARDSDILNSQGVGILLRSKANGKLTAEGWFDVERLKVVDERVLNLLEAGEKIEVSTGLFTDNEPAPEGSIFNGKPYTFVARNYRPDHLAILPDQTGACSIDDGCGVLNVLKKEGIKNLSAGAYAYVPDASKPSTWKLRIDDAAHVAGAVAALGKGFRGQKVQLPASAVKGVKAKVRAAWLKAHPDKSKGDLPRILVNKGENEMTLSDKDRKKLVEGLIANSCCWNAEDQEELLELTDNQLSKLQDQTEKVRQQEAVLKSAIKGFTDPGGSSHTWNEKKQVWETKEKEKPEKKDEGNITTNTKKAEEKKPQTTEEWMKSAPSGVQSAVRNAMAIELREKAELIERLTMNLEGDVKESLQKSLQPKPLEELQALSVLAPPKTEAATDNASNYSGAGGGAAGGGAAELTPVGLPAEYL